MLFAACDKIDTSERLIEAGGNASDWADGAVAYIEKYTGPLCGNCPLADRTLENLHHTYGDRMIVVSVTSVTNSQGNPYGSEPSMQVEATRPWEENYGAMALPLAFINRDYSKGYSSSMSNIGSGIDEVLKVEPVVMVSVEASIDASSLEINTDMQLTENHDEPMTLTLLITEDSLVYTQYDIPNWVPDYKHNHMLRAVVTDSWGKSISMGTSAGSKKHDKTTYNVSGISIQPTNSHVVALVCDATTHRVLGCAQCDID